LEAQQLDLLCINTLRTLAIDAVQKAKSGHPGMPMGASPMAYVVWTRYLKHNPKNPAWMNRDRFVLSAGHGSMLLYALLHLTGYDLSLDDLKSFRQWESATPGHPEYGFTPGVETTTGPLGQGFATGVGMALAERFLASSFNKPDYPVINYRIWGIVSDGDLMEGISSEAASLAGHLGLGNIIYLYDDNRISIDGPTALSFTEDVARRFEAYGWHVQSVEDGNDPSAIDRAIVSALAVTDRPHLIRVRTHIGFGSPHKQDSAESHGSPLGDEEVALTKQAYGWDPTQRFHVPSEALALFRKALGMGQSTENTWRRLFEGYRQNHPHDAEILEQAQGAQLNGDWIKHLPQFTADEAGLATREASGKVLAALAPHLPTLVGGSADLTPSNNTYLKGYPDFQSGSNNGRNIRFGVREHAMGAILNGIALTRGMIPYGGTFLVFSDYMRPSIRLAALMGVRTIYVFTHDSIGLGEDGPTHQPIEHLAALRAIPNLAVIRPADANETVEAWKYAIERRDGPVALALSRQKLPVLDRSRYAPATFLHKGAYVLAQNSNEPRLILLASGSELHPALAAYAQLTKEGIACRIVSFPCWEIFDRQPDQYKLSVLSPGTRRLAVEAGSAQGWHKYVGADGEVIGIDRFGASAPADILMRELGFTVENILARARRLLSESPPRH
jgi:transketolase